MNSETEMFILILARHYLWTTREGEWWYDDAMAWTTGLLLAAWLIWFFVGRYMRSRALKRAPQRTSYRLLERTNKIKRELSSQYLRPGFSANIHAVGIGIVEGDIDYCIQVFINDANDELWVGSGAADLPNRYRGVPVVLIEMPRSGFLSAPVSSSLETWNAYPKGIRESQEVMIGGISGANAKLAGQSGTIGYFCTRKSKLPRRKEIHLLSNSHVFADLRKTQVDDDDLILQPSPGERSSSRPVGTLVNFSALKFEGRLEEANHVDAAIAKLWSPLAHRPLIPLIGTIQGHVATKDIEVGERVRKFGRTTGYTEGQVFSIYLDIWIRYDRTGQSAFFANQILIEPALPEFARFVSGGDSGSLLVDKEQHAIGLIFAGVSEIPESLRASSKNLSAAGVDAATGRPKRIEGYGVANPITEVMDQLKIDLLV
jgi:hypothetical protein